MRSPSLLLLGTGLLAACGSYDGGGFGAPEAGEATDAATPSTASAIRSYLTDPTARRAALVSSLVNPENGYSVLRLEHYDTGDAADWSRLPESNPRTEAVALTDLDASGGAKAGGPVGVLAGAVTIGARAKAGDLDALVEVGRAAFFHYPAQESPASELATGSRQALARYGFWADQAHGAGGLVREEIPEGGSVFAFTCSTCHAAPRDGALVIGLDNDLLNVGKLLVDASSAPLSPAITASLLAWGPGRVDVTTGDGTEPVRIGDLRPVSWLGYLQADATVKMQDIMTLAIRIETLIITSHNDQDRPPREVSMGLAAYIYSLKAALPSASPATDTERRGEGLFETNCSRCHESPSLTGPPVPLAEVGTNPTVGLSLVRGTGTYRVPSLHGVSARRALLHDASLPTLDAMFDPSRVDASYTGGRLGPGPIAGHVFGLDLDKSSRAALVAYLETL